MRIALAATGATPEAGISEKFGRAPWFVIVDASTLAFTAFENPAGDRPGGAGPAAVQALADRKVKRVLAGRIGPKAEKALAAAGIRFTPARGTVADAIAGLKEGEIQSEDHS
jgi:predicted Fe-Mo cluster-binding NifX family protein